ncbi:hypothetical protein Fleli_3608 [Bernardetia litoralis DSM 6794]|uniref:Uncharacterized protein n=1 Tax=Bernardetia litoralis (strain ATCC 23117 / DSM 6794 / NBRC 15988 / NCIMB 1366 / Fx l1 / Sio-4) TaxID=880071 RepID=I4APP0_BERLS|nr:hypothetical protein [Bernardetia litoralis]AFM05925.1 hypothetical protein Fleli_3608 [Bernardetia litoralis DSM 6794]
MKKIEKKVKPLEFKKFDKILLGIFLGSLLLIILPYDVCFLNMPDFVSRFFNASLLSISSFILIIRFWNKKLHSQLKFRRLMRFGAMFSFVFILLFNFINLVFGFLSIKEGDYIFYESVSNNYDKITYAHYKRFPRLGSGRNWELKRVYRHDFFPLISIEQDYKSEDINGIWKCYGYPNEDNNYKRTVRFLNGEVVEILDSVKVKIKK